MNRTKGSRSPGQPPKSPATRVSAARLGAARALLDAEDGAHLEDALDRHAPPEGPDRDLSWFLAYGVLRRRGHVDAALRAVLTQPLASLDGAVRVALRIGAFERLYARTPSHAVVDQGVELVRALGAGRAHGLVNAVLRKVKLPERLGEAESLDHPGWLVARWKERYGPEATAAWAAANALEPPLFVVAKGEGSNLPPGATPITYRGEVVPGVYEVHASGPIPEQPGFVEGDWWVQDLASVMVADLVDPGGEVLDACAAPGGKSFRLASRGADVTSVDRSPGRLEAVKAGAARLGLPLKVMQHDWTYGPFGSRLFDSVLVDAPCTGLGTVRRHPEIRWRRTEPDLYAAAEVQQQVLSAASEHVRPGGALVYAVCSPEPEEGEQVIARFLADHPRFFEERRLVTSPPERGEDAHFAVRMRSR